MWHTIYTWFASLLLLLQFLVGIPHVSPLAAVSTSITTSAKPCVALIYTLAYGTRDTKVNSEVSLLQRYLAQDPTIYPTGLITGYFGSVTKAAVRTFQLKYQLSTPGALGFGRVGPATRAKIRMLTCVETSLPSTNSTGGISIPALTTTTPNAATIPSSAPVITSISPTSLTPGYPLTISGINFAKDNTNTIHIGSTLSRGWVSSDGTTLVISVPQEVTAGNYGVGVETARGISNTIGISVVAQMPPSLASSTDAAPAGFLDVISPSGVIAGWTVDSDVPSQSTNVTFYMDGPKGTGQFIGTIPANGSRPDVNMAMKVSGDHGYQWQIPSTFLSGTHSWYVYGIDASDPTLTTLLTNSPKMYTFVAAVTLGSLNLAASANTSFPGFKKYLYTFPLPSSGVNFTGLSGNVSMTSNDAALFSETLVSVNYVPSGTTCPPSTGEPFDTYDQIGAKYQKLIGLSNFILKIPNAGTVQVPTEFTLPLGVPVGGCLVVILDGGIPASKGTVLTMTSNMVFHYALGQLVSPVPSFLGASDEFCFGQEWGCELATKNSALSFGNFIPVTASSKLLALSGDVSDSAFSSGGTLYANPPTGPWSIDNDYYIYRGGCPQSGIAGPSDYYATVPPTAIHLLNISQQGTGETSLQQPVFKSFNGIVLNAGDCYVHLVKTNANGGIDAENQVFALIQPSGVSNTNWRSGLASVFSAFDSAIDNLFVALMHVW